MSPWHPCERVHHSRNFVAPIAVEKEILSFLLLPGHMNVVFRTTATSMRLARGYPQVVGISLSIPDDLHIKIRSHFFSDHWKIGTIAAQLGVHPDTVKQAINWDAFSNRNKPRPSCLDDYVSFCRQVLLQYPKLTGTRLFEMLSSRGYGGSVVQVRRYIKKEHLRPEPIREAFFKLATLPGEQGQADWAYFGTIRCGQQERKLWFFVVFLPWSHAFHVHFSFTMGIAAVLKAHVDSFAYFGGVTHNMLFDNAKTIVLERQGDAIRYHPRFYEMAGYYLFSPRVCNVRRPNEKGGVERFIRQMRDSFLAGRTFCDIQDVREQFASWRDDVAYKRPCPGHPELTVAEAFAAERQHLLPLPIHPIDTSEMKSMLVRKQPYLRFDTNLYSVPHQLVGKTLTLSASEEEIRILEQQNIIACHRRCWERGQVIEDPKHLEGLLALKSKATCLHGRQRLVTIIPETEKLYIELAQRGEAMGPQTAALLKLLDRYGKEALAPAIVEALQRGTPRASSVAAILEKKRRAEGKPPVVTGNISNRPEIQNIRVAHHNLEDYDELIATQTKK